MVTHGNGDHFGGAQYLADQYGARVVMARPTGTSSSPPPAPTHPAATWTSPTAGS
ncbi:MBL fold metallo-hydrolase [Streptomyces sp. DG2A-72]|uniref:MBL fold metallo-hydrolase n=1 Tax=Streptomyces sp. DG2A-72 TaxID=3051386 RepID=UPI0034643866